MTTLVVMAKECVSGRVKTRLHPPFSLGDAARIAHASLLDTLEVGRGVPVERRMLCFSGSPPAVQGWDVVAQEGTGLDERIAAALDACDGPTVLIGMDTPQLRADELPVEAWPDDVDAWFGPATDGGFWMLGLREPRGDLVRGIVMSQPDTGRRQRERLESRGLRVEDAPTRTDIDCAASLAAVAPHLGHGHLARLLAELGWPA